MEYLNPADFEQWQTDFCSARGLPTIISSVNSKIGFALSTQGKIPVNGLRHPATNESNGWFIWCGEELSSSDDFFLPIHTFHLLDLCPDILRFLGLPAGYRFLAAGEYLDIWFDEKLLMAT